jgi:2-polyprenyl-3-methyl-5-hydroxy-6-metoxy-1,4-benzoquinol methylase
MPEPTEGPSEIDLRLLAAEIEAEVRARRAAGEYPPSMERELDELFARFAPPEVSTDFGAALEKAEDLVLIEPIIPTASQKPVLGVVKKVVAKLIAFYHAWLGQQISSLAISITNALRLLGDRVRFLEQTQGDVARARAAGTRIAAVRDDAVWAGAVVDALKGATGRIAVIECGDGALLEPIVAAGFDAYGVESRSELADAARQKGLEVRFDAGAAHLQAVANNALDGIVLRAIVERAPLGELLEMLDAAAERVRPGGRIAVCSIRREAWGTGATVVEADILPGRPLQPQTWAALLADAGFTDVNVVDAGTDAYVVRATRSL